MGVVTTLLCAALVASIGNEQQLIEEQVDTHLSRMTVSEKVGQLIMIGFGGTKSNEEIRLWVGQRKVGGAVLFSRNIVDLAQTAKLTRDIAKLSLDLPPFIALDQEGGNVVRVTRHAISLYFTQYICIPIFSMFKFFN